MFSPLLPRQTFRYINIAVSSKGTEFGQADTLKDHSNRWLMAVWCAHWAGKARALWKCVKGTRPSLGWSGKASLRKGCVDWHLKAEKRSTRGNQPKRKDHPGCFTSHWHRLLVYLALYPQWTPNLDFLFWAILFANILLHTTINNYVYSNNAPLLK